MPQKLKTSFDPILAPVITQKLAEGDKKAVAKQVRQVGFWIIAAQAAIALALGIPGEAVMGLVGAAFVGGTAALAFLLAAEVVAATAAVSEARSGLCRAAPQSDDLALMIAVQAVLTVAIIVGSMLPPAGAGAQAYQAAGAALALALALGMASVLKARLLCRLLGAPVQGWRWPLVWAAAAAVAGRLRLHRAAQALEWVELALGVPLILVAFGWVVW